MCYIILPVLAFVCLLWSTAAPLFGLFSTDWFVGSDGQHYGLASGCPETDSLTVPFTIPSSASSSVTAPPANSEHAYSIWTHSGTVTTKTYYSDDACAHETGSEKFDDGACYFSPHASKAFNVAINGTLANICMYGAGDNTCSLAGSTCYKRAMNKCLVNDKGMSAVYTRRRQAEASPAASSAAPPKTTPAAKPSSAAPAPATTEAPAPAPTTEAAAPSTEAVAPATTEAAVTATTEAPAATTEVPAPVATTEAAAAPTTEAPAATSEPATGASADTGAGSSTVTFCKSMKWSYLSNNVEEAMAIMCIIAGGLGVICLIAVLIEVLFRWCFKPHPRTPQIVALFSALQFIAIAGVCITMIGYNQWTPPEGTHIGPAYWAVIIGMGASLAASVLMCMATCAERSHYKGRFKVFAQGRPAAAAAAAPAARMGEKDSESTANILGNERSSMSLASGAQAPSDVDIEMSGASVPPPPPPPPPPHA